MSAFGQDRERLYDRLNREGYAVTGPDGTTPVQLGDRIRAYQEAPDDRFDFWVKRDARRDGLSVSAEAVRGVAEEIARFIMARAQLRIEEGWPPDEILIDVGLRFAPEPPSPQHRGAEPMHRSTRLGDLHA